MTDGQRRPLLVGGVAGGVGASTFARALSVAARVPVHDLGVYRGADPYHGTLVDLLITSNTAAATGQLGRALALCPRPPVLIIMHTVPGGVNRASTAHLRSADPHLSSTFQIYHQRQWPELEAAPGKDVPKSVLSVIRQLPAAVQAMYRVPIRPPALAPAAAPPGWPQDPQRGRMSGHLEPTRPAHTAGWTHSTGPPRPPQFPPRAGPAPASAGR